MEEKYFNRYRSFCRSLRNLEKSKFADPTAEFVLEGTIRNYILTFDLAWKVMKDILVKQLGITDFAIGSPREVLQSAFTNGLISDDIWLKMLKTRNLLAHDYDGIIAKKNFRAIISNYYDAFDGLKDAITKLCVCDIANICRNYTICNITPIKVVKTIKISKIQKRRKNNILQFGFK